MGLLVLFVRLPGRVRRHRRVPVAERTRPVPGILRQRLGRLRVFVPRSARHQAVRGRAHLRRRGRVPGRDGRVFAPVHKHGGLGVLRVPGRVAAGRRLENVRGRGRVFGPGATAVPGPVRGPGHVVPERVRFVRVRVGHCDGRHVGDHRRRAPFSDRLQPNPT